MVFPEDASVQVSAGMSKSRASPSFSVVPLRCLPSRVPGACPELPLPREGICRIGPAGEAGLQVYHGRGRTDCVHTVYGGRVSARRNLERLVPPHNRRQTRNPKPNAAYTSSSKGRAGPKITENGWVGWGGGGWADRLCECRGPRCARRRGGRGWRSGRELPGGEEAGEEARAGILRLKRRDGPG